jgi:hypothetical protein
MKKTVFFAFRDNPLCFIHVLLNSLDMAKKGMEGKIVLEGESVTLVPIMAEPGHFLHPLYLQAKNQGLFLGACRACTHKLHMTEAMAREDIPLIGEMSGHPAMSDFIEQDYTLITF